MADASTSTKLVASIEKASDGWNSIDDSANASPPGPSTGPVVQSHILPTETCLRHGPNKIVEMYCEKHQIVGCVVCMMEADHNFCNKMFIPHLPDKTDAEINELLRIFTTVKDQLKVAADGIGQDLLRLTEEKNFILQEIEQYRERIIAHVQKIADNATSVVNRDFMLQKFRMNELVKKTERQLEELEKYLDRLRRNNGNKSQVFVDFVNASKVRTDAVDLTWTLGRTSMLKTLRFEINQDVYGGIRDSTSLGELHSEFQQRITVPTEQPGTVTQNFVSCCTFRDGSIIVVDMRNQALKKLDHHMQVVASLSMRDTPGDICTVGKQRMALTLPLRKRVVLLSDRLKKQTHFYVGLFCYAIEYHRGRLYVVCRPTEQPGSAPDDIYVFNTLGIFQTLIQLSPLESRPSPRIDELAYVNGQITTISSLASDDKYLYMTSSDGAILQLDKHHKVVSIKYDEKLQGATGVSLHRSKLYICNGDKSTVLVLDTMSNELNTLFTSVQGVNIPNDVCHDVTKAKLVVLLAECNDVLLFESVSGAYNTLC